MIKQRHLKQNFTLVELLVVIAIIAILASMLLPAIGKARDRGKQIACMNNMRQCGLAFNMYANEHNGYITLFYYPFFQQSPYEVIWHETLIGWRTNTRQYSPGYLTDFNAVICPSVKHEYNENMINSRYYTYGANYPTNYNGINAKADLLALKCEDSNKISFRLDQVPRAETAIGLSIPIIGESVNLSNPETDFYLLVRSGGSGTNCYMSMRHNKKSNVLLSDGHVESVDKAIAAERFGFVYFFY